MTLHSEPTLFLLIVGNVVFNSGEWNPTFLVKVTVFGKSFLCSAQLSGTGTLFFSHYLKFPFFPLQLKSHLVQAFFLRDLKQTCQTTFF